MRKLLTNGRVKVPRHLDPVTNIDRAAECDPQDAGMTREGVADVWSSVEKLYRTGIHPAITLVLRRHGKIVMKRAIGSVSGTAPGDSGPRVPLDPDSPISLFSASKSITSLLVHKLVDQGKLELSDRVADYIPEFASHGKRNVTIRQLMSHRAGIPTLPMQNPDPEMLRDWDSIVRMLCAAPPFHPKFEKQSYHALTGGFIIGELVRRVSGKELPDALRDWLAEPLGCKHLTFGLPRELRDQSPPNVCTGVRPFWPVSVYAERIIGVPFERAVEISNSDAFLSGVVPAGNIYASADDASRVFQMLLNHGVYNGTRVLKAQTVVDAVHPVGARQLDGMLMVPLRFTPGFMLGENPVGLFGPRTRHAFGHLGFVSVLCWADPSRDISVALLNTGKSMAPTGVTRLAGVLGAIANACAPTRAAA